VSLPETLCQHFVVQNSFQAASASLKVAKEKTASSKSKKVADHPSYARMIEDALVNLNVCFGTVLQFYMCNLYFLALFSK